MNPRIQELYQRMTTGASGAASAPEIVQENKLSRGEQMRRIIYNLVAHPDLPKFMFGKKGELLRTVGVMGMLALVGSVAAGYLFMKDKELVILRANQAGLKPVIGEPGQLGGLEANNEVGIGWGIYPRGEVDWERQGLVAGTDCLVVEGEELTPPRGVTWAVPKREPDQGYRADGMKVEATMGGMLTIITVNYAVVSPDFCR